LEVVKLALNTFRTVAKLWPAGTDLGLDADSTDFTASPPDSAHFDKTAAQFVSPDGVHNHEFLFWNTGRHITGKRHVIWNFTRFGWGTWTATRWYGTPGGNGGPSRVRADAFDLNGNALLTPDSPIDAPASTYSPATATPLNGDDHAIGTAAAGATVVAHAHMGAYDFAGWLRLVWGGDPNGDFIETDDGTTGAFGSSSFYTAVDAGANPFTVAMGESADLLAGYVPQTFQLPGGFGHGQLGQWWEEIIGQFPGGIPWVGDPSPMDLIRLSLLENLVQRTQPGPSRGSDLQRMIEAAPRMTMEELNRAKQSLQTSLDLAKSGLSAIEARLKSFTK
jgi:hypothetical protein